MNSKNEEVNKIKELAKVELKKQNYDEAIKLYTSALSHDISDDESSVIYCNRSYAHYKLFTNSESNEILLSALNDALNAARLNSKWYKPYARLGLIYSSLNDLVNAEKNFEIALSLSPNDEEIKNLLSNLRFQKFEQDRKANFDERSLPRSSEEYANLRYEMHGKKVGYDKETWQKQENLVKQFQSDLDPSQLNVSKGHEYFNGSRKTKIDHRKAAEYFSKAASAGNPDGIYNLAKMYANGTGVKQDYKRAFDLLIKASESEPFQNKHIRNLGVAEAEHLLGIWYQEGIYVNRDYQIAVSYYERAIQHGFGISCNNLGSLYYDGNGVEKDTYKAECYFLWAYRSGENLAISNLVKLYLEKNDAKKALLWHERALEKKDPLHLVEDANIRSRIELTDMYHQMDLMNFIRNSQTHENNKKYLEDPFRIHLIKSHRENIYEKNKIGCINSSNAIIRNTFKAPKKQININSDLKPIYLNEIDFAKDHVLNGFTLKATIIDILDYLMGNSIFFIIEDSNRNVERMAVYNLGNDYEKICKEYCVGTIISIKSPYIRMAADGKPMIRIDDPSSSIVIQAERKEKMCRFCGEENSKYLCAKCLKSCYCSKECQISDFKILNHKLICSK